jgi:hypothetical protein
MERCGFETEDMDSNANAGTSLICGFAFELRISRRGAKARRSALVTDPYISAPWRLCVSFINSKKNRPNLRAA